MNRGTVSTLVLHADIVDNGLKLTGVLLSSIAVGSGLGITAAVFEKKSSTEIEMWGFRGTAVGCALGILVMIIVAAIETP